MPNSDNPEYPDGCYLCGRSAGSLHHISYVPEKVVLVCSHCHGEVHSEGYDGEPLYPDLVPGMSRGEWKEEIWNGEWIPRPTTEQIEWGSDGVGTVER